MAGPLALPPLGSLAELPGFLGQVSAHGAWTPVPGRAWTSAATASAPVRSLAALLASRGERVHALDGAEGPIAAASDADAISRRIGDRARGLHPSSPSRILDGLVAAARELAANVTDHARAGATGFASLTRDSSDLLLLVSDCGIGIERSVRANPDFAGRVTDTAGAVALALQRAITPEPLPSSSATGLPFVSEFCRSAGGEFAIVTGGISWRRRVAAGGAFPIFVESVDPWQGTIVALRIPAP
ncbi:MAG: hypothetical protein L0323_12910 [Planctomycetes bacterium]|nr:hypothetical protein [Planctomycetota bacterium]